MENTTTEILTEDSKQLFIEYVNDAPNWSGSPCVGGNVSHGPKDKGNLTDLKKKGLLATFQDEGLSWVIFTPKGVEYARTLGLRTEFLSVTKEEV